MQGSGNKEKKIYVRDKNEEKLRSRVKERMVGKEETSLLQTVVRERHLCNLKKAREPAMWISREEHSRQREGPEARLCLV